MLFSQRLRSIRNTMNLNQKEFANLFKINPVTLSHYENGKREPDLERLFILCQKLNVSADYLLGLSDSVSSSDSQAPEDSKVQTIASLSSKQKMREQLNDQLSRLLPDQLEIIENLVSTMTEQNKKYTDTEQEA